MSWRIEREKGMNPCHQVKIKQILNFILMQPHKLDQNKLNSLIDKLAVKQKEGCSASSLGLHIFKQWLMESLAVFQNSTCPPEVIEFTLNVASLLSKNEELFIELNRSDTYSRLIEVFCLRNVNTPYALHYINLVKSLSLHKSGLEFLLFTGLWEDLFERSLYGKFDYVYQCCEFMAVFLEKVSTINEKVCWKIVEKTMESFHKREVVSFSSDISTFDIEYIVYEMLKPTLSLLCSIFKYLLESSCLHTNCHIIFIFTSQFHLDSCLKSLMHKAEIKDFIFDLSKVSYLIQFFELYSKMKDANISRDVKIFTKNTMEICKLNVMKNNVDSLLKFCYFGFQFWRRMVKLIPEIMTNSDVETVVADELVTLQLLPIYLVSYKFLKWSGIEDQLDLDHVRRAYLDKICKALSEPSWRLAFMWRNVITDNNEIFEQAQTSLSYIIESRKNYSRHHGVLIFQGMIYSLRDICQLLSEQPILLDVYAKEAHFLILLLDCLAHFIEEFSITWQESVESICVLSLTVQFLSYGTWQKEVTVKALQLMNISLTKYMAPNLALLVDKINDWNMMSIGPLLYSKLHDSEWEVRNSALQVLCTVSQLASSKFPSLQDVILKTSLPQLVLKMAIYDDVSFTRATALQCLYDMVRVDEFWKQLIMTPDFPHCLIQSLHSEVNGTVKKEITVVLRGIYESHWFRSQDSMLLYEAVTFAFADPHWKVKLEVLTFWKQVIKKHLQEQGMIDGTFPAITFSKEKRKIIALTESEICRRLNIVLTQLSYIGCLNVLVAAIKNECNLEVLSLAIAIMQSLSELLDKYKMSVETTTRTCYQLNDMPVFMSQTDMRLPTRQTDFVKINGLESKVHADITNYQNISEFISCTRQNFDLLLTERKIRLKGKDDLELLMDDLLRDSQHELVGTMDCN